MASIEYGAAVLATKVIMVLAGVVKAIMASRLPARLARCIDIFVPLSMRAGNDLRVATEANARV